MKSIHEIIENGEDIEKTLSVCFGTPRGDELPQVAGIEDIVVDVYSDILNVPREYALGLYHHQYNSDDDDIADIVH